MIIRQYELVREKQATYHTAFDTYLDGSEAVASLLNDTLKAERFTEERFYTFMCDTKGKIIGFSETSKGDLSSSLVHPREVFKNAISTAGTSAIIVAHNHPSGNPTPSQDDIEITKRLAKAGEILGIKLLDHIITGHNENGGIYTSLRTEGYIS